MFIILYIITYDEIEPKYEETNLTTLMIKSSFFTFISVVFIIFLSHNNMEYIYRKKYGNEANAKAIEIINAPTVETIKPEIY